MNWFINLLKVCFPPKATSSETTPRLSAPQSNLQLQLRQVTMAEFLMGRDKIAPLTDEMKKDAKTTVELVNQLLALFGKYRGVNSGYRPAAINAKIPNAAKASKHMICRACDLEDKDGELDRFCMAHQDELAKIGLWLESPTDTPGWCHVQIIPPNSGHRVFIA